LWQSSNYDGSCYVVCTACVKSDAAGNITTLLCCFDGHMLQQLRTAIITCSGSLQLRTAVISCSGSLQGCLLQGGEADQEVLTRRFSIHCMDKRPGELQAAQAAFPAAWPGTDGIYHLGYTSQARGLVASSVFGLEAAPVHRELCLCSCACAERASSVQGGQGSKADSWLVQLSRRLVGTARLPCRAQRSVGAGAGAARLPTRLLCGAAGQLWRPLVADPARGRQRHDGLPAL